MVLEILCIEPIYPQYSRVLETYLALRYWFFEVLGSESVNARLHIKLPDKSFNENDFFRGTGSLLNPQTVHNWTSNE